MITAERIPQKDGTALDISFLSIYPSTYVIVVVVVIVVNFFSTTYEIPMYLHCPQHNLSIYLIGYLVSFELSTRTKIII